jgi:phosphatidylserine/phosphatidylglycerophosphate/cardiolipin synthase-like enzyme
VNRIAPAVAAHPGESGFLLYNTGEGGIQARVALADVAQSSLDAQYYMWAGDAIGRVLLDRVMAAANRGVRVRLLVDDYSERGHDVAFTTLDAHPNIEVRVFNPYARGWMRLLQYLGRFNELNRRMHNKLFVADGKVAVVGGRNLTDDYFGMGKKLSFRDFDLLAIGPVVAEAEGSFDQYWNSRWSYPITSLTKPATQAKRDRSLRQFYEKLKEDEMKPWAASRERYIAHANSSKAHLALHGKAAVFDRKIVLVGSFNLDPRSAALDTETVFVVNSPELAAQFLQAFATDFEPANAWHIGKVAGKNKVGWITEEPSKPVLEPHDPASSWRRFVRSIEKVLPIRSLL